MNERVVLAALLVASAGAIFSCTNGDAPDAGLAAGGLGAGATSGGGAKLGGAGSLANSAGTSAAGGAPSSGGAANLGGSSDATSGGASAGNGGGSAHGGAGGGGASGGSANLGGASGAGGGGAGNASLPPFGPAPVDKPNTVEIGVRNGCNFSLFIHGDGGGGTLQPDDQELKPGAIAWYDAPQVWNAARVTAYTDGPRATETDKVEMTFDNNAASGEVLNYNVTYVDWLGLPVEIVSRGSGGDCKPVGCYIPQANVTHGCPDGLLDGKKCQSARSYCLNPANQAQPYCNALAGEIQKCAQTAPDCAGAAGSTTPEVYACSGAFFSGSPKWCAALNRHTLANPDSTDKSTYYQTAPYNTYSKWVHDSCPGIYAFPYDDYPSTSGESGFHSCTQGKELDITFCPEG